MGQSRPSRPHYVHYVCTSAQQRTAASHSGQRVGKWKTGTRVPSWTCSPDKPDYDSQALRQSRLKPTLNPAPGELSSGWGLPAHGCDGSGHGTMGQRRAEMAVLTLGEGMLA